MIINVVRSLLPAAVLIASVAARAETPAATSSPSAAPPTAAQAPLQPPAPAPKETPPPPATQAPPPPHAQPIEPPAAENAPRSPAPAPAPPAGQWVYTRQYGWLWMPYEQAYTYVVPDAALAYMFVYYPNLRLALGRRPVGARLRRGALLGCSGTGALRLVRAPVVSDRRPVLPVPRPRVASPARRRSSCPRAAAAPLTAAEVLHPMRSRRTAPAHLENRMFFR